MVDADAVHLAQEPRDDGQLLGPAAAEPGARVVLELAIERGDGGGPRGDRDEDAPAIGGVAAALGDTGSLETLREIKGRTDGDVVVSGSATLVRSLLDAGLVDELHLLVGHEVFSTGC